MSARVAQLVRRAVGLDENLLADLEGDRRWYMAQILLVAGVNLLPIMQPERGSRRGPVR